MYSNLKTLSLQKIGRSLGVWLIGLFVYYMLQWRGKNSPGESWTAWSWYVIFLINSSHGVIFHSMYTSIGWSYLASFSWLLQLSRYYMIAIQPLHFCHLTFVFLIQYKKLLKFPCGFLYVDDRGLPIGANKSPFMGQKH